MTVPSLDPVLLSRLASLPLRARAVVEGVLTGMHRSPRQGQAVEFAQHKEYAPGDELRHIDWRAVARVDKHYVKKFQLETNLRAWVVLDCSGSMGYGRNGLTKLAYGQLLAAVLAHLLIRQQDMCGLVLASAPGEPPAAALLGPVPQRPEDDGRLPAGVRRWLSPRSSESHLAACMEALEVEAAGATALAPALTYLAEKAESRPLVFVLSDLLGTGDELSVPLALLRRRGCDVVLLHLLDDDELRFPFDEPSAFFDLEGPLQLEAHPAAVREGYLEALQAFLADQRERWQSAGAEYHLAPTNEPPDKLLLSLLAGRRASRGGR